VGLPNPNQLVTEDTDLMGATIGLMKQFVDNWGTTEREWPVKVRFAGSADQLLDERYLLTMMQASGLKALGIVFDADDRFDARWNWVRTFCAKAGGVSVAAKCPADGLVISDMKGIRFGAWIMPDNKSAGMLENFCHTLVPENMKPLWDFAKTCVDEGKKHGANYVSAHTDKAHIHTWLALQNPPGERIGNAITKRLLDSKTDAAKRYASWFKTLYKL
jgi:hypothetical protein